MLHPCVLHLFVLLFPPPPPSLPPSRSPWFVSWGVAPATCLGTQEGKHALLPTQPTYALPDAQHPLGGGKAQALQRSGEQVIGGAGIGLHAVQGNQRSGTGPAWVRAVICPSAQGGEAVQGRAQCSLHPAPHVCSAWCTHVCSAWCTHVCSARCTHVCPARCMHVCSAWCTHVCSAWCTHVCSARCTHVCSAWCTHVCSARCTHICSAQCTHVCSARCAHVCSAWCTHVCSAWCTHVCSAWCTHVCSTRCAHVCSARCTVPVGVEQALAFIQSGGPYKGAHDAACIQLRC